jgi:hypothetical protein
MQAVKNESLGEVAATIQGKLKNVISNLWGVNHMKGKLIGLAIMLVIVVIVVLTRWL